MQSGWQLTAVASVTLWAVKASKRALLLLEPCGGIRKPSGIEQPVWAREGGDGNSGPAVPLVLGLPGCYQVLGIKYQVVSWGVRGVGLSRVFLGSSSCAVCRPWGK